MRTSGALRLTVTLRRPTEIELRTTVETILTAVLELRTETETRNRFSAGLAWVTIFLD